MSTGALDPARPAPRAAGSEHVGGLTHGLIRGRHPIVRRKGESKVSAALLRTDTPLGGKRDDLHLALEYGVDDRFTLGAEVGPHPLTRSFLFTGGDTSDHLTVSAMYALNEQHSDASSLRLDVILTDRASGDSSIEWRPTLLAGRRLDEGREVYGGIGAALADEPGDTERLTYNGALAQRLSGTLVGLLELDGALGRHSFHELYLTPGIVFGARKRVQVRAGVPIGLSTDSADYQVLLGLAVIF